MRMTHLLVTTACFFVLVSSACPQTVLHVAPTGSDDAAGTEAAPFATLQRARDEVRAIKQRDGLGDRGARVIIHAVSYTHLTLPTN